jgi:hydrophobe/amphiphile efflux-1 (HAE1) family protein
MQLSTWAIKNPIPPIVLFLALTVGGLYAFMHMPVNNMPSVVVPIVAVNISQPGAAATEVEAQITKRVEGAIAGLQGVKKINSTITEGYSSTIIEFQLDTDFDRAVNDARDAISNIREQLPRSIQEPNIRRIEVDGGAILTYSVEAPEKRVEDLSWLIDDAISRELLSIRGVASITRQGGVEHEVTVTLDADRLNSYGITAADVSRQLAQTNLNMPGGRATLAGVEYTIRTLGSATSIEGLRNLELALPGNRAVRLGDIATVADGGAEQRSITRLNGKPVITFSVFRSKGSSEVQVAEQVELKLHQFEAATPGVKFKEIFSLVTLTEVSFKSAIYTFFEGALLTIIVVFLFLRDRRATMIAAVTIPLSIIPTFLVMYFLGFSLNTVSMLAITLVTGVLVDDAIVEIENIHRHMREGKKPYEASIVAAEEIGLAVVATTLVICAVFAPVSFMPGIIGQFFIQFGMTVVVAAFFSLVIARLLTPMMAAYLLKDSGHDQEEKSPRWLEKYGKLVHWTLDNRLKTLGFALVSLVISFGMIPFLSTGFLPYEDYSESNLTIELPRGATAVQTDAAAQQVAEILQQYKEVDYVLTSAGVNEASISVKLVSPKERDLDQRAFENMVLPALKKIPNIRITFANSSGAKDVSIALVGEDGAAIDAAARAITDEMRAMPDLSSVASSASLRQPEITVTPDFAKAAAAGVSVQAISDLINIATIGDTEANLAKFNAGNRQIPIRVRLPHSQMASIDTLRNLQLPTNSGDTIPLAAVATITFSEGPTLIERYNRMRKVALEANLNGVPLSEAMEKIYALPSMQNLPKGVEVEQTGDAELMGELFSGFLGAVVAGLMMVYLIQVLLYKDWIQPFTRMAALPLSIGGAFLALLITGTDLNLPAVIGLLMLMGIADKNSILLVDYMLDMIHKGTLRREAIIQACMIRAKPIIMTSLAMLAGMLPIALGIGLDTAFRAPMAIAVIGGLISSTALSLIFVPVLFSYVRDFEEWLFPKIQKILT